MLCLMGTKRPTGRVLAMAFVVAGCGAGHARSGSVACKSGGFAASLVRNTGGQPTALAAAQHQAEVGVSEQSPLPRTGWTVQRQGGSDASVEAGNVTLHAVTGSDGTWFIDAGTCSSR